MNNAKFLRGMGLGMAVGAALGMTMSQGPSLPRRSAAGKAAKAVGEWMEQLTQAIGL